MSRWTLRFEDQDLATSLDDLRSSISSGDPVRVLRVDPGAVFGSSATGFSLSATKWPNGRTPNLNEPVVVVFDSHCGAQLVSRLERLGLSSEMAINDRPVWSTETEKRFPGFADALDGLLADLDRLDGQTAEYGSIASAGLDLEAHGHRLLIDRFDLDSEDLFVFSRADLDRVPS